MIDVGTEGGNVARGGLVALSAFITQAINVAVGYGGFSCRGDAEHTRSNVLNERIDRTIFSVEGLLPRETTGCSLEVVGASDDGGEVGLVSHRGGLFEVLDGGVSKPLQVLHSICVKALVNCDFGIGLKYFSQRPKSVPLLLWLKVRGLDDILHLVTGRVEDEG